MYHKNKQPRTLLVFIILSISLLLFAVACGGDDDAPDPEVATADSQPTVEPTAEPTDEPEPTAVPEPTDEPEPTAVPEPTDEPEPEMTAVDHMKNGDEHLEQSNLEEAIAEYDQAIALDAELADAYFKRGRAYSELGDIDAATADFDTLVELEPDEAGSYFKRGVFFNINENFEEAVADLTVAIEIEDDYAPAYLQRADAYQHLAEFEGAILDYEMYLLLEPDAPKRGEIEKVIAAMTNSLASSDENGRSDESSADMLLTADEVNNLYIGTLVFDSDYRIDEDGYDCRDFLDDSSKEFWYRSVRNCIYDPNPEMQLEDMLFGHELESVYAGERDVLFYGFLPEDGYVAYDMYIKENDRLYFASITHQNPLEGAGNAPQQDDIDAFLYAILIENLNKSGGESTAGMPSNMIPYTNEQLGLTLEYPSDWVLTEIVGSKGVGIAIGSDEKFSNTSNITAFAEPGITIQIRVDDLSNYTATTLAELQAEMLGENFPSLTSTNKSASISIPGEFGNKIEGIEGGYLSEINDELTLRFGITTLVQNGRAISMISIWGSEYEDQMLPIVQTIFNSIQFQLTAPEIYANIIFASAQVGDYSALSQLCHPDAGNDGDTQAICDVEISDADTQASFISYFQNGKVTGYAHFNEDGTHAEVPFLFGPDGDKAETMEFIFIDGKWYLYSF